MRHGRRLLIAVLALAALAPAPARAQATYDLRGDWDTWFCPNSTDPCAAGSGYESWFRIRTYDATTGDFTGDGSSTETGATVFVFAGTSSGSSFDLHYSYGTSPDDTTAYHGTYTGTLSGAGLSMAGTSTDSNGVSGTFSGTRGSLPGSGSSAPSTAPSEGDRRRSATHVNCDWFPDTATFSCTAQVGDASGLQPPAVPTGYVTLILDPATGGAFPQGDTCGLQPSQTGGPTGFCSVAYQPPNPLPAGTQPALTAYYHGDWDFQESSGRPANVFVAPPPEEEKPPPPAAKEPPAAPAATTDCLRSLRQASPGSSSCSDLGPEVGKIYEVKGKAYVRHTDGTFEEVHAGSPLYAGDKIVTDEKGVAAYRLALGAIGGATRDRPVLVVSEGEVKGPGIGPADTVTKLKGIFGKFQDSKKPLDIHYDGTGAMGIKG